jgi:hypothetical protein
MIWTLFVISMTASVEGGEVKWTRYSEHKDDVACIVEMDKLNQEFTEGEEAVCLQVPK